MLYKISITILFENPFWIGVYERTIENKYEVCKITFGQEPKDYEVYDFLIKNWSRLIFSKPISSIKEIERKINPKRMKRQINSQLENKGIGTKAQQALKIQHEQSKIERKIISREMKEMEKERKFYIRMQKKKQKHKGR